MYAQSQRFSKVRFFLALVVIFLVVFLGLLFFKTFLEPSILMFSPTPGDPPLDQAYSMIEVMVFTCVSGVILIMLGITGLVLFLRKVLGL